MNVVLLLLAICLSLHWGLASTHSSTSEDVAFERSVPADIENHSALALGGVRSMAFLLVDQGVPAVSAVSHDRDQDPAAPRGHALVSNAYAAAKTNVWLATAPSPSRAFQARAPPSI